MGALYFSAVPLGITATNTKIAQDPLMWVAAASVCQGEGLAFGSREVQQ